MILLDGCTGWWYRPEFIINELNVNSVITTPAHDAVIPVSSAPTYTVRGYAYSGENLGSQYVLHVTGQPSAYPLKSLARNVLDSAGRQSAKMHMTS